MGSINLFITGGAPPCRVSFMGYYGNIPRKWWLWDYWWDYWWDMRLLMWMIGYWGYSHIKIWWLVMVFPVYQASYSEKNLSVSPSVSPWWSWQKVTSCGSHYAKAARRGNECERPPRTAGILQPIIPDGHILYGKSQFTMEVLFAGKMCKKNWKPWLTHRKMLKIICFYG